MTKKLDEIIKDYSPSIVMPELSLYRVYDVKEIAIAYAKVCLEKAAEEATIRMEFTLSFGEPSVYYVKETEQNNYYLSIHKDSITNIELP